MRATFPMMAKIAESVSLGEEAPEYEHRSDDEIGILSKSFNRMRRSLDSAMKMLDS